MITLLRLLEAMAEYNAIEDTLYFLDRALACGSSQMNLHTFLRVRYLCVCVCCGFPKRLILHGCQRLGGYAGNTKTCRKGVLGEMLGHQNCSSVQLASRCSSHAVTSCSF